MGKLDQHHQAAEKPKYWNHGIEIFGVVLERNMGFENLDELIFRKYIDQQIVSSVYGERDADLSENVLESMTIFGVGLKIGVNEKYVGIDENAQT